MRSVKDVHSAVPVFVASSCYAFSHCIFFLSFFFCHTFNSFGLLVGGMCIVPSPESNWNVVYRALHLFLLFFFCFVFTKGIDSEE